MSAPEKTLNQLFDDSVARNASAILIVPSAAMDRKLRNRFLDRSEDGGVWIGAGHDDIPLLQGVVESGRLIEVHFVAQSHPLRFFAPVLEISDEYRLNGQSRVLAIRLGTPTSLEPIQRRACYRVKVAHDESPLLHVWRIAENVRLSERPMPSTELKLQLVDLSIGGMGVRLVFNGEKQSCPITNQRVRVQLKHQETELILEGRFRPPDGGDDRFPCGITFVKLESDLEGRKKLNELTKLIGVLQREEVRRVKLARAA